MTSSTRTVVLALLMAPGVSRAEVLYTFADGSSQSWVGYQGKVTSVAQPSADGAGALAFDASLLGRGWSEVTVESPETKRNLTSANEVVARVQAPANAPGDVKAQLFVKSGDSWTWSDGGWEALRPGAWVTLTLPVERIANPGQVRAIGVKVGGNSAFTGMYFLDQVEVRGARAATTPSSISVSIVDIVPNSRIQGRVVGIPSERVRDYKVLVYVRTDRWYVHPYERGGDGLSYANINADGSWQIQTVLRSFPADTVAALVVPRDAPSPSPVEELGQLHAVAEYREPGRDRL